MTILRLLWKEWRDHRTLILAWMVLGPVALWLLQFVWMDEGDPLVGWAVLPGMAGLFAVMLAAEAFCSEFAAGTSDFTARLPVRTRTLWLTKVGFILAVVPIYFAWSVSIEFVRTTALGLKSHELWSEMYWLDVAPGLSTPYLTIAAITAAVMLFGTVLRRGFPAVLAGGLFVFGFLAVLQRFAPQYGWLWDYLGHSEVLLTFIAALLVAAFCAYTPWRHSRDLRRAGLAVLGFGLIAVPGMAKAGYTYHERTGVSVGDPVRPHRISPSPDGRYLAVDVSRGLWSGASLETVWIMDLKTGGAVVMPIGTRVAKTYQSPPYQHWSAEGELLCMLSDGVTGIYAWVDPATGAPLRPIDTKPDMEAYYARRWLGVEGLESNQYSLTWDTKEEPLLVQSAARPRPGPVPGSFFIANESGDLLRCEWGGERRVLYSAPPGDYDNIRTSHDRNVVTYRCWADGSSILHILNANTGELLLEPACWDELDYYPSLGAAQGIWRRRSTNEVIAINDGEVRRVSISGDYVSNIRILPGGGFIVSRQVGHIPSASPYQILGYRLERLDDDGEVVEVLHDGTH